MSHPSTRAEIVAALHANAQSVAALWSGVADAAFFDGDSERWSPAHHLVHLTEASAFVRRALESGALPPAPIAGSRTYAEVRDAAAATLSGTDRGRLRDMGRRVVVASGADRAALVAAFVAASDRLAEAIEATADDVLDRATIPHPLLGPITVREMLFFTVVHERHHTRLVQTRFAPAS